ncbi:MULTISPECIES: type VI secretion system-associated protein TagF [unclassified Serratia (in: enterobacteria)]|uniref:type VI secretion system-associated protein TagF n=1 Tax=unclassified Serratia (in: enterobacteria) TaxID=2647522 RepID=UPI00068B51E9|nr:MULTISPECIES: type VI secretion system-associated protein TagF [unclassified Serratia (in: enterobacteria)]
MTQLETSVEQGNGIGWYGKIPSCGDFVQRRLPATLVNQWAHWFQSGLIARQLSVPPDGRYSLNGAPMWNFVLPATLGTPFAQLGYLLASQDRVGRHYPLLAMWLVSPEQWRNEHLSLAAERYYGIGQILQRGVHQCHSIERIDRALQALPLIEASQGESEITPGWPMAVAEFDPLQYGSFWWSTPGAGKPFDAHIHSGNLTVQLFHHLFEPVSDVKHARQGLYGPMFD